ncbi:aminotransferase class I/II-fold pyridoxal phosphate-dependent enzyme [Streptomyces sp. NRRL S-813]|uniref:aminotransferase class I/II-fold pyridoxal phosphate-dependent enzyme n=1 Tax=Streptomyces sp. NRRL S-813 TaxID=1463919 RepID=UPI0006901CD3|nr:aminotransferase class I/II-fold pyridoxal phosphate-dependent enzyme [Streptomyces sp. NRRL S-813]
MLPDALADVCATGQVSLVHLQPTLANPSGRTMPASRRAALAEVCARADVWVLEDDPLGPLAAGGPDPVAALLPDRTCHVTSTAKALALGLRIGVAAAPEAAGPDLAAAVRATTWLTAPLLGEVFTRWVDDGTADTIVAARRAAVRERNAMATEILAGLGARPDPAAPTCGCPCPTPGASGSSPRRPATPASWSPPATSTPPAGGRAPSACASASMRTSTTTRCAGPCSAWWVCSTPAPAARTADRRPAGAPLTRSHHAAAR